MKSWPESKDLHHAGESWLTLVQIKLEREREKLGTLERKLESERERDLETRDEAMADGL